ncbi:MAG: PhzF family phenazine biosynthesis protein [Bacteroidales bacterium]|nr:PhzF family phenazine biosynthesis protein [Bacteroidales bacterium]
MRYYTVDAFAQVPFGGNPAGVVLIENGENFPEDETMRKIAAEMRYSETAFVQQNGAAEFTVRYFTPAAEVDLCGHATIASFSVLREEGIVREGFTCINHTKAGDLEISVGKKILMEMATPEIIGEIVDTQRLKTIMDVPAQDEHAAENLPTQIVSTGLPDIIFPVASVEALNSLNPNIEALSTFSDEMKVVGVHAFALSDDGYTAHVRNFAPLYDIPEESATGTANGALTYYLFKQGIISSNHKCSFMQGEAMQRPSVVETEIKEGSKVYVGGNSYILTKGEMNL